ncbi:S9 family peptidase [Parendozoicomonas haliclonae]|uniref:Protease 2 n=1 Tax=Parendozoicomonas haliclonae TaxID=1960125 RepID=A0A1X7AKF8_9GAMM|nr:S9 family peptidase [Parendozoicomonas haliclonae]SMA47281.1 Protease 2 [Parendozoicomonas haliclonae]
MTVPVVPLSPRPPFAPKEPVVRVDEQGRSRTDDYFWLEDRGSQQVQDWLEAENRYTAEGMAETEALQKTLYQEMKARMKEDDESLPYQWRGYEYFSRTIKGEDYAVHYRRKLSSENVEVLFDGNLQADGQDYFDLGVLSVSPDNNLLGWAEDFAGDESWTLCFRDIETNRLLPDTLKGCSANIVWASDSRSFWYIRLDKNFRPWQLCHHMLGQDVSTDQILFEEPDERFFLSVYPDRTESFLLVESASTDTTECYIGSLDSADVPLQLIRPRQTGLEYYPDSDGQTLFIRTNDTGINYRLVTADPQSPAEWHELLAHREQTTLGDFEIFPGKLVLFERETGLVQVRLFDLASRTTITLDFPDEAWSVGGCDNAEFEAGFLRLEYESLNRPPSVYDVSLVTGELTLRRQQEVLGGFDPERYQTRRLMIPSHDGIEVPVSLVGLKESFDQPAAMLLYGYGAYGASEDPYFAKARLNLLDRGMIFGIAHVRGGADLGEAWYRDGRRLSKKNSFEDFVACSRYLIEQGYTSSDRLVISGGSAGGLLMGAVLNQAPELFAGAVLDVPFVDVLNSMLNPDLPLTVTEYDEWGDPAEDEVYNYIASYSPIDNIRSVDYPPQLVLGGFEDRRVQYWEPAKWVATMRDRKTDSSPIYLKTHMGAGHFGASGRYEAMKEAAFEQAFILTVAGLGHSG